MSDTPRTDAVVLHYDSGAGEMAPFVETDFARQLERELAAATDRAEKAEAENKKTLEFVAGDCRALAAKLDASQDRVRELEAALKPFADEAGEWTTDAKLAPDNCAVVCQGFDHDGEPIEARFTVGDLRRAAAIASKEGGQS